MSFELVIFDCDGVLVDSEPVANRIFTEELNRVGVAISHEEVCRAFIGLSMDSCIEIVEARSGRKLPAGFLEELQARTFAAFREELQPVAGVAELLNDLRLPYCVASSGEPEKMRLTLGLTGLLDRFEGRLFSACEVERGKPAPDLFLHAARAMDARPERCAVIEDSLPGVQAARAAGMTAFGYAPLGGGQSLAAAGATVFRSMVELEPLLTA